MINWYWWTLSEIEEARISDEEREGLWLLIRMYISIDIDTSDPVFLCLVSCEVSNVTGCPLDFFNKHGERQAGDTVW